MSLTRRNLFKGAAATGATLATGGAGKVVQGAVVTAGGAGGQKESKIERTRAALSGKSIHRYKEGMDERNYMASKSYEGKIDFSSERHWYEWVKRMPSNIPLMELLSDATYQDAIASDDIGVTDSYGGLGTADPVQLSVLRKMLEPLCDETTTASDLKRNIESYFINLGKYAISNPDDFVSSVMGAGDDAYFSSQLSDLANIVEDVKGTSETEGLYDQIFAAKKKLELEKKPWHLERIKQAKIDNDAKIQERLKQQSEEEKQHEAESGFNVKILRTSDTEYMVGQDSRKIPSRKDWFNWLSALDPEDAKICDIKTSFGGYGVTLQNQIAIDYLDARTDETHTSVVVEFPPSGSIVSPIDH